MQVLFRAMLVALLLVSTLGLDVRAQSVPDNMRAEVAFEVDLVQLRDNALGEMMGQQVKQNMQRELNGVDPEKINRIHGVLVLPESVKDFEGVRDKGVLPMEFYAQIEFADSDAMTEAFSEIEEEGEPVTIDGETYYRPPADDDAPENLRARKVNDTTFEIGTEDYIAIGSGDVHTENLKSALDKLPAHAIRVAVDIDSARDLIEEAIDMAKGQAPPMFGGFLDIPKLASNIRFSLDFGSDQLLTDRSARPRLRCCPVNATGSARSCQS